MQSAANPLTDATAAGAQLFPDQPLTAAPFAFNAQTLGGPDASTFVQQSDPAASGLITQGLGDARYASVCPTTQQLALLRWYAAISVSKRLAGKDSKGLTIGTRKGGRSHQRAQGWELSPA